MDVATMVAINNLNMVTVMAVQAAKNASTIDYRRATGFEAVMGYLYLKGDYKRMIDLIRAGLGEV